LFKIQLREIVLSQKGIKPQLLRESPFDGSMPYIDISFLETGKASYHTSKEFGNQATKEDVLVVWDGTRVGMAFAGVDGIVGSTLTCLTPINITRDYLLYFLKSQYEFVKSNAIGSTGIRHVDSKLFFELEIPYQEIKDQKQCVVTIKERLKQYSVVLENQKEALRDVLNATNIKFKEDDDLPRSIQSFRQAMLKSAFRGDLTKAWRLKSFNRSRISNEFFQLNKNYKVLEDLPSTWSWTALGNAAVCERGRFNARPRNDPKLYGGKYPFIQISDIPESGGIISDHKQTLNEGGREVSKLFPVNTIVVAIVGSTIGNSGILGYDMCFPDSIIGMNAYYETTSNEYLEAIRKIKFACK